MKDTRIHILTSNVCNNNCLFCMEDKRIRSRPQFSAEEIFERISKVTSEQVPDILFTGNEPTLNKDLELFIKKAKQGGFRDICIVTNGRMLSDSRYLSRLIESGLNQVNISLHGSKPEIHDSITRVPGSFRQTLKGIKNLIAYKDKIQINLNTTIIKQNIRDLNNIIEMSRKIGPNVHVLNPVIPLGRAEENMSFVVPRYSDIVDEIARIRKQGDISNIVVNGLPRCVLYGMEGILGSKERIILPKQRKSIVMNPDHKKIKKDICVACKDYNFCEGVWKGYADHHGMQEFKPIVNDVGVLNITPFCNQSCIFCSEGERKDEVTLPDKEFVKKIIEELADKGIDILNFMGGETSLREDMGEIIDHVAKLGIKPFLTTNGSRLNEDVVIDKLRNLALLDLSYHGWDAQSHKNITSVDNFHNLLSGISKFQIRYPNKPIIFKVVINSYNYSRLIDIARSIEKIRAEKFYIHLKYINIQGKAVNDPSLVAKYSEIKEYLRQALDYCYRKNIGVITSNIPLCILGDHSYTSMDVYTNITQNRSFFLNKVDINKDVNIMECSDFDRHKRELNDKCKGCKVNYLCEPPSDEYLSIFGSSELEPIMEIKDIEKDIIEKSAFVDLEKLCDEV